MGLFRDEGSLENFGVRTPVVTRLVSEYEKGAVDVLNCIIKIQSFIS